MDLSLYFLYFSTYCIFQYCTYENCTKVYSFWKKRKKTWERQVHQNHVTGPFHRKIIFIVNSIFWGGVTQMTMFNPDTDCTYVCFVTLLPTSWTWSVKIYRGIALWYRAWQLSLLKFVYKISPEKKTYIGGVTTN